jgi:hypothetical protein
MMATAIRQTLMLRMATDRHPWLALMFVGLLSSCSSDSSAISVASGPADTITEKEVATVRTDLNAGKMVSEDFAISDPSPSEPVTAAMKIRPDSATAGETVEILVHARIARGHYLHATSDPGETFVAVAMGATIPNEIETLGDWQLPAPEVGQGNALVYRNSIVLRRSLKLLSSAPPQTLTIVGELQYQVCTDELCWPTGKMKLSAPLVIRPNRR